MREYSTEVKELLNENKAFNSFEIGHFGREYDTTKDFVFKKLFQIFHRFQVPFATNSLVVLVSAGLSQMHRLRVIVTNVI